jgi:hypothetical protein
MNPGLGDLSVPAGTVAAMTLDDRAFVWFVAYQHGVVGREQAADCGVTDGAISYRIRPGGPWQCLLPGVYLTATGQPSWEQRQIAALLFAGAGSLITGPAALLNYRIKQAPPRVVDVLIPLDRARSSPGFVRAHRTRRMPESFFCDGPIRFAPPERAVADTVRTLGDRVEARAVIASAVQQGRCTTARLAEELRNGPIQGSANLRAVLAEVMAGIRSAPEGDLRKLITRSGLPKPLYNPRLFVGEAFLAQPDAWWPEYGVVVEVDSREWHLSPADWEQTMARHRRMSAGGIIVLHVTPRQLRDQPTQVLADIAAALRAGRPLPAITTRPLAA